MKHYILYYHGGSRNHGCEALVRTTAELLDYKKNKISLASFRPSEDQDYGINKFCDIHSMFETKDVSRWNPKWIKAYSRLKLKKMPYAMDDMMMLSAVSAKKGDIAVSIGGDNYCYYDTQRLIRSNELWRRNGIKTVLWGCSIEPESLDNPVIKEDISRFDLITARESISYEAIKKVNKNTILVSDSAFMLKTEIKPIPKLKENFDLIGVNLSPLAESLESVKGITIRNYEFLIEYILSRTNMNILLIPHVVWDHDDDRKINNCLFEKYCSSGRIFQINDCNCMEIKGYISQCRFFIGARTHATIAAYSSCVPTLVLGYSVKSRGIAKDLFGKYDNYVLPVQKLENECDLLNAFIWMYKEELEIKKTLMLGIEQYKELVNKAKSAIAEL